MNKVILSREVKGHMEDKIAFKMIQELSGFNHIYGEIIDMCYESVCHKYGLSGDKELTITKVRHALGQIYQ